MFKKKEILIISIITLIGSISQPLIAYSYILLGDFISLENNSFHSIVLIMILAFLGIGIYYFISAYIKNAIVLRIRKNSFKNIIFNDLNLILERDLSEHINLLNIKIETWKDMYLTSLLFIIKDSLQIVFMLLILFSISYKVTIIVLLFTMPLILNNIFFPRLINKKLSGYFDAQDLELSNLKDILQGVDVIKNSGSEEMALKKMEYYFKNKVNASQKIDNLENASGFLANCGVAISQISGVFISSILLSKNIISLGQFMGMLQLTFF
ncbi:MAG: ABC transporter transmembrane domain-containing protein [Tissierellia bacterium]|nr:ABC transporter transmembrane domain-containing protein [Tissierellia bacterium]